MSEGAVAARVRNLAHRTFRPTGRKLLLTNTGALIYRIRDALDFFMRLKFMRLKRVSS